MLNRPRRRHNAWSRVNLLFFRSFLQNGQAHRHENIPIWFWPLKPHFYIVKLGFTEIYIIFLISAPKQRLWVLVRTASVRRFWQVHTIYVLSRNKKNIRIFIWKLSGVLFCTPTNENAPSNKPPIIFDLSSQLAWPSGMNRLWRELSSKISKLI